MLQCHIKDFTKTFDGFNPLWKSGWGSESKSAHHPWSGQHFIIGNEGMLPHWAEERGYSTWQPSKIPRTSSQFINTTRLQKHDLKAFKITDYSGISWDKLSNDLIIFHSINLAWSLETCCWTLSSHCANASITSSSAPWTQRRSAFISHAPHCCNRHQKSSLEICPCHYCFVPASVPAAGLKPQQRAETNRDKSGGSPRQLQRKARTVFKDVFTQVRLPSLQHPAP